MTSVKQMLAIRGLDAGYGGSVVVQGVSLCVAPGRITVLIGPNGAGKSTLLKTVAGLLAPISGILLLGDRPMDSWTAAEAARYRSAMFTERRSAEDMSCREVVEAGRTPYTGRLGILSEADHGRVREAMEMVGAWELAERSIHEISDGQKQRVLLARALCQEPEVLILDEPTSYLDLRHKLDLLEILKEMSRDHHLTVIMSLHEIDLAQKVSDHVMAVKGETIYGYGRPADIFREDLIRDLYDLNNGTYDPLFGSVELPAVSGDPEVFVLSSGGSGIPVFRRLQQTGVPFAVGILYKNDIDYPLAKKLAAQVISEEPFREIGEDAYRKAERLIRDCRCVIDAGFAREKMNRRMSDLAALADDLGILEKRTLD